MLILIFLFSMPFLLCFFLFSMPFLLCFLLVCCFCQSFKRFCNGHDVFFHLIHITFKPFKPSHETILFIEQLYDAPFDGINSVYVNINDQINNGSL